MFTPWGSSHTTKKIAEGIIEVTTGSHGGIFLSEERWTELMEKFPKFQSWAGKQWFEEDCDWAIVPVCWPEFYDAETIYFAVRSVERRDEEITIPLEVKKIAAIFSESVADLWERGSMGTMGLRKDHPNTAWQVHLSRGDEEKSVVFPDYPEKFFYSDEELQEGCMNDPNGKFVAAGQHCPAIQDGSST